MKFALDPAQTMKHRRHTPVERGVGYFTDSSAELSLAQRFEAAYQKFGVIYFWKARLAHANVRFYSSTEFYEDLCGAAGEYGLFAVALWSYFRMLHTTEP